MRILVASKIDPDAVAALQAAHDVVMAVGLPREELLSAMGDREALIFRSGLDIDRELLDAAPELHEVRQAGGVEGRGADPGDGGLLSCAVVELAHVPQSGTNPPGAAPPEMTIP